ncbi:MAG: ATP-binding protein [Thermosipho sp. (in: Bacteria)]|nr:ATP-binding protein [Thermosipho sp. (in: thermotogales)]
MNNDKNKFNLKKLIVEIIEGKIQDLVNVNKILENVLVSYNEAHNFLKKEKENEMKKYRLNSFEILAKESRKKGIFLCIITQRPGDIPEEC